MKTDFLLQLDNGDNHEFWWATDDPNTIHVDFNTPDNYPNKGSHTLSVIEAMRQLSLMLVEGWSINDIIDGSWHKFISEYDYREYYDDINETVQIEIGVASYEGNLQTWFTEMIDYPLKCLNDNPEEVLTFYEENIANPNTPIVKTWIHHIWEQNND